MPRRERRLGVAYIHNDKERDITFYKRRGSLFKASSDLSIVTGARVAVVLDTDRGKVHSFGTPSAKPIVDAFLSGVPPTAPFADEAKTAKIARLQSMVARLDMKCAMGDKRKKLSIHRMKHIKDENPGMVANLVFSKEEDLSMEDLDKLFNELSRVQEDIKSRLPPLHHGNYAKNGGPSMTRNMLPPRGPTSNHLHTAASSLHFSRSQHLLQHQLPSVPLPPPPEQTFATLLPMQEVFAPQDPHLRNYPSPCNIVQHNLEDYPLLANSNVNDLVIDNTFGYDPWGYPMIDQGYYNGLPGMDSSLGYNGSNLDHSSMENGGWGNAPPESSFGGQDVNIHALCGGLL